MLKFDTLPLERLKNLEVFLPDLCVILVVIFCIDSWCIYLKVSIFCRTSVQQAKESEEKSKTDK